MTDAVASRPQDTPTQPSAPLALVEALGGALQQGQIRYCHWKSNVDMHRSLSGDNDLDLLVDRRQAAQFEALVGELGFKRGRPGLDRRFPGVQDLYGFDTGSGRLVHLHLHYQLILGQALLKNLHLPVEQAVLDDAERDGLLRTPAPAWELLLFVLRMIVKTRAADALRRGHRVPGPAVTRELDWLLERADTEQLHPLLERHLPGVPRPLFDACLAALEEGAPLARRLVLKARLLAALGEHARRGPAAAAAAFVVRRATVAGALRLAGRAAGRRPDGGGLAVALVGSDGAGKSTARAALARWLGRRYAVRSVHMGHPPRTLLSRPWHAAAGLAARVRRWTGGRADANDPPPQWPLALQAPIVARAAALAWDRWRQHGQVRRWVGRGDIVLCDRYPLAQLEHMDGPRAHRLAAAELPVLRSLAQLEAALYRRIQPPELTLVLRLPPALAARRQPGDDRDAVLRRGGEVLDKLRPGPGLEIVDASRPVEQVLAELKQRVWRWV